MEIPSTWRSPPPGTGKVEIWIIDSAAALTQDPARWTSVRLASEASLVVAVALVDRGWDEATVQTVCELAAGNITTWVITYGTAASSSPLATPGLSQFLSQPRMSALHVGPGLHSLSAYSGSWNKRELSSSGATNASHLKRRWIQSQSAFRKSCRSRHQDAMH